MFEKVKKYALQVLVLILNLGLVGGGVIYFKKQQEKKEAESEEIQKELDQIPDPLALQAQKLEQIIANNSQQKNESISNNPAEVTVQQSKVATETIPGETTTVKKAAPAPAKKTTKKS
ncbi:MAG: hypothetical protein ACD_56C00048G0004 [uncultured bacterium]|nr:MAG: hypothetical protein ACD_56C00048G0004 [uncultured bacterium]